MVHPWPNQGFLRITTHSKVIVRSSHSRSRTQPPSQRTAVPPWLEPVPISASPTILVVGCNAWKAEGSRIFGDLVHNNLA